MSWIAYYIEVSGRQHEDELRRRHARPGPTPERIPKQRLESWRRLWGRPWSRLRARPGAGPGHRPAGGAARGPEGRITPAGR